MCRILPIIFVFSYFLSFFNASAQAGPKPNLLSWTEQDGLSDDNVLNIIKAQDGLIWIGTTSGICRFDGQNFETFNYDPIDNRTVAAHEAVRLKELTNGNIWIGTDGAGLSIFDYNTKVFKTINQDLNELANSLIEDRIYCINENKENEVFVGYRAIGSGKGGITIMDQNGNVKSHELQDQLEHSNLPIKVSQLIQDQFDSNIYWLGGRSFFRWDRRANDLKEFHHSNFSPGRTSISNIIQHNDSTLLVGLIQDGIWEFNTYSKNWGSIIHDLPVSSFVRAKNGAFWVADSKGIGLLDSTLSEVQYEVLIHGASSPFEKGVNINKIASIDDNLWICTTQGLYCWSPILKQFNTKSIVLSENRTAHFPVFIDKSSDNEWFFSDPQKGLILTDSSFTFKKLISFPKYGDGVGVKKAVLTFVDNQPTYVVGLSSGLATWSTSTNEVKHLDYSVNNVHLKNVKVWSLKTDTKGNVWIGTQSSGLLKLNLKNETLDQFEHDPLESLSLCHNKYLFEIDIDSSDNLWICTDKGISSLNLESGEFVRNKAIDQLQNYVIHAVELDHRQNVWIGTRNHGLFYFNREDDSIQKFTTADGLLFNGVNELILEDSTLWLSTRNGLCKINVNNKKISQFGHNNGLLSKKLYSSKLNILPNKKVMLTYQNSNYFSVFSDKDLAESFPLPTLAIKSFKILSNKNKSVYYPDHNDNIDLRANENYFSINFSAIDFYQPKNTKIQYILEGYNEDWIEAEQSNTAIYSNLPGGNYQFKVRVRNFSSSEYDIKRINISLAKPWYNSILFYFAVLIFLSLIGFLLYKIRTQQIRKEENFNRQLAETEMKALRAQINPHFIFNCLNSIKSYIIDNKIEAGTEYIGRFSQLIRMILNNSKERMIPMIKEIEAIKIYIWLEQERMDNKFDVEYNIALLDNRHKVMVPPLLFQPYIENAIWHGLLNLNQKGKLILNIVEKENHLLIEIIDNGVGIKNSKLLKEKSTYFKPSLGLELSQRRIEEYNKLHNVNATVSITPWQPNHKNTGTKVDIRFPFE